MSFGRWATDALVGRLAAVERELNRIRNSPLNSYNRDKRHEKQLLFHACERRNKWVFGGNRSGKTECGAVEAVRLALCRHAAVAGFSATSGWIVSVTTQVQRDVAQAKFLHYLPPERIVNVVMSSGSRGAPAGGVIDYIDIRNDNGGVSRVGFKSCEMGREKFQGASLDFVWFDEEPPKDIYDECRMRIMDKRGRIFGTMTPLKGLSWVYDEIFLNTRSDPEIFTLTMEWGDNPFLDPDEVALMTKSMASDELESRRYGRFVGGGGLVYPAFDPCVHVIEPFNVPIEWYDNISIDPGLNNPTAVHWYACDGDGNVFVIAEHYEAGRDVVYHADVIKAVSKRLGWHTDSRGRFEALIDSAASSRTLAASKSVAELFADYGINVNTRVNKELYAGISRVRSYLRDGDGRVRLFIFSSCPNLIREFKGYRFGQGDVPVKADDHALDELRYYIMNRPEPYRPPVKRNYLAAHKDRLARESMRKRK